MTNGEATVMNERFDRLERQIEALTAAVGGVASDVGILKTDVGILKEQMSDVQSRLGKVQMLAEENKDFSKNVWDSLSRLRSTVEDGFTRAEAETRQQFEDQRRFIASLDRRVTKVEEGPERRP